MTARTFDLKSRITPVACGASMATAAGTGDATAVTGATINRKPLGGTGYDACVLALGYKTTLGSAETLKYQVEVQEADESSTVGTAGSFGTATVLQASTTQETGVKTGAVGVLVIEDTGFKSRKQYVRYNFTPDLSASGTDTAVSELTAVLGGADRGPVS